MQEERIARIVVPACYFNFLEEPGEPKPVDDTGVADPLKNPPAPHPQEPKSIETRIADLKDSDPQLFNTVFGRGVKKGETSAKPLPLDENQVAAAIRLFEKVKPEQVDELIRAKKVAEDAALEKLKQEKNFQEYTEHLEAQHKEALLNQATASERQIVSLQTQVESLQLFVAKLRAALSDLKITRELLSAGKAKGLIDPTDAIVQLAGNLSLNDDLEIVVKGSSQKAEISQVVDELVRSKPHLVKSTQGPGTGAQASGSSNSTNVAKRIYKRSELLVRKFYLEHEADIRLAAKEGRITDDIGT